MRLLKKILKITLIIITLLFITLYVAFYQLTKPKPQKNGLEGFPTELSKLLITTEKFKGFEYRHISIQRHDTLPTLVFVHGTIGSGFDFKYYLRDSLLLENANMIAYDRIGYNYNDKNDVQESIAFEAEMLDHIIDNRKNVILVGYSYGGPIVLASKKDVKKIVLLAPAVYSEVEPMPFLIYFFKWKITRWLVPPIWKQASKEKISHKADLKKFEDSWSNTKNTVISIHGNKDKIVPYENSLFLERQFPKEQFELITIRNGSHSLVWTHKKVIKEELLKLLE